MVDKYCSTKAIGNESKAFREHTKGLLELRKKEIETYEMALDQFEKVQEFNDTRKAIRVAMLK